MVFRATATGLDTINPYVLDSNGFRGLLSAFGFDFDFLGDIDLDGRDEIAIGTFGDGVVLVREISTAPTAFGYKLTNDFELIGSGSGAYPYGYAVQNVGTFVGFGFANSILVADPGNNAGQLYLYR